MPKWEIRISRVSVQRRASDGKQRTVGHYQVFHNGVPQNRPDMFGAMAESRGPGANSPAENGRRVEAGTYPLATQLGGKYVTLGYVASQNHTAIPRPGLELLHTGERSEILIHPGIGFLASIGCINLCTALPDASEMISYTGSRRRVIAVIDDLTAYLGADFPSRNGKPIRDAFAVIEGEP